MAADVFSTPKLLSLDILVGGGESVSKSVGPFRATQLWNDIIANLKNQVEVKRRRLKMRQYEYCFTGSNAVDVVFRHLLVDSINFHGKEITRENAVKLCKQLMSHSVFEPVMSQRGETEPMKTTFEDSNSKFYRFMDDEKSKDDCDDGDSYPASGSETMPRKDAKHGIKRELEPDLIADENVISNPIVLNRKGQVVQEIMEMNGTWKRYSMECLRRLTPARLFTRRPSLPDANVHSAKKKCRLPPAVETEIWREVALSRLLMLVELPVLDNILSYDPTNLPKHKKCLAFSNLAFRREESFGSVISDKLEDQWMEAALDLLECHPKGLDVLEDLQGEWDMQEKYKVYQHIVNHYKGQQGALWSEKFTELQVAILNLLMQDKTDATLEAIQLSTMLLGEKVCEELRRLFTFMKRTVEDKTLHLSSKVESNRSVVENTFTPSVIKNKVLTPHQSGQLVMFMMDNHKHIMRLPQDIEEKVQTRINQLISGQGQPRMEVTYCSQVSREEFQRQQMESTEKALVDLVNLILDDTAMTLKVKKQRLKQLQKTHPDVYQRHFADIQ